MRRLLLPILLVVPLLSAGAVRVEVLDPAYDEFEGLDLVEALIRDGRLDEAEVLLRRGQDSDRSRLLKGDLALSRGQADLALSEWQGVSEKSGELVHRRAQAYARLDNWSRCAEEFESKPARGESLIFLEAACLERAARFEEAWLTLQRGGEAWTFEVERIAYLLRRGLRQVALERSLLMLASKDPAAKSRAIMAAEILAAGGASAEALRMLEAARVKWAGDPEVLLSWAQVAHQHGFSLAVAEAYEHVAWSRPKYFYHAAELWRQSGRLDRSLMMNTFIVDEVEKLRQRVALAVDQGRYDQIIALAGALSRSELAMDDEINYALSYAYALWGSHSQALRVLDRVTKAELLHKVSALRKSLESTTL